MAATPARQTRGTPGPDSRAGALWGLAHGDALSGGGDLGPSLALWDAVSAAPVDSEPDEGFVLSTLDHLLSWYATLPPDAPSPTLAALRRNGDPASWVRLAVPERARATVVRAAWLGVHPRVPTERVAAFARAQALATDAHPVSPAAAEVAAALTGALARGQARPGRAAAWVRCYVAEARTHAPDPVLEHVAGPGGAGAHVEAGWATLVPRLCGRDGTEGPVADAAWETERSGARPGEWEYREGADGADGTLATALRLLDAGAEHAPSVAVARAAATSPSAAALLGAFLGATRGPATGTDWVARLVREDREALTLRECGEAPRRFTTPWRLPVRSGPDELVGAPA